MTKTLTPEINIDAIADHEDIERRFTGSFDEFVRSKKLTAAVEAAHSELSGTKIAHNEDFIGRIAEAIDDEAIVEKRFIFISVNREYIESIGN